MLHTLMRHLTATEENCQHERFLTLAKGFLIGRG
jgi:hypothetical protein